MPTAKINDLNIYYEQHGEGEDLILISGYSAKLDMWQFILPTLKKQFRVTLFDNRGVGRTDVPVNQYSIEDMASDVIGLMDHLNIKQATVVGHSMGGFILQVLLAKHPERFKKALLLPPD